MTVFVPVLAILTSGCGTNLAPVPKADTEIYDVVLSDLIGNKDFDLGWVRSRGEKFQIVVGDRTCKGGTLQNLLRDHPSNPAHEVPLEIRADLKRRNPKGASWSLAFYQPETPNILVRDLTRIQPEDAFWDDFPHARCYVEVHLPGYSSDGRTALLSFFLGPAPGGLLGYYLLKIVHGHWEVVWRSVSD